MSADDLGPIIGATVPQAAPQITTGPRGQVTAADWQVAADIVAWLPLPGPACPQARRMISQALADQREQLTPRGPRPVAMSINELAGLLTDVRSHVRLRDSYGGSIAYDAMGGPPCPQCTTAEGTIDPRPDCPTCSGWGEVQLPEDKQFWVHGAYRIGNLEGQGGMRIIGELPR